MKNEMKLTMGEYGVLIKDRQKKEMSFHYLWNKRIDYPLQLQR